MCPLVRFFTWAGPGPSNLLHPKTSTSSRAPYAVALTGPRPQPQSCPTPLRNLWKHDLRTNPSSFHPQSLDIMKVMHHTLPSRVRLIAAALSLCALFVANAGSALAHPAPSVLH